MRTLVKELFIIALLLMIVVFTIGMVFYEYMPNNKIVPEPITYTAESSTTAILQEIATLSSQDSTDSSEPESVIKSYSVGAKELSTAASKHSYTSGKTDPFSVYTETINMNTVNGNTVTNTSTNTNTTYGGSTTVQNPNSTGTFFENKTSK